METKTEGALTGGDQTVTVVLQPSRALRLEIVDAAGTPQRPTRVDVVESGGSRRRGHSRDDGAEFTWKDLPLGPLTAHVQFGPKTLLLPLDPMDDQQTQTLVVPTAGGIEGRLEKLLPISEFWSGVLAEVTEIEGSSGAVLRTHEWEKSVTEGASGEFRLAASLLPGRYRIAADWIDYTGELSEDDNERDPHVSTPLFRGEVEVRAGEVTRFRLEH